MIKKHQIVQKELAEKKFAETSAVNKKFTSLFDKLKKTEESSRVEKAKAEYWKKTMADKKAKADKVLAEAKASEKIQAEKALKEKKAADEKKAQDEKKAIADKKAAAEKALFVAKIKPE